MLTNTISGVFGLGSAAAVGKATKGMTDGSVRKAATEFAIGTTADTGAGITTAVATDQANLPPCQRQELLDKLGPEVQATIAPETLDRLGTSNV